MGPVMLSLLMVSETIDRKVQRFWSELRRRRVVRVVFIYAAGAWLLVEVAAVSLEAFEAEAALKYVLGAALLGFPVALVLSWMFDLTPHGIERTESAVSEVREADMRSIAVLPFVNFSDDHGNEYFSDGLSEEIRNQLAKVPGLRVAARTSSFAFKGKDEDARNIGQKLNVGAILEGGVRKHEDMVRISAELVNCADGYQLWSETFERRLDDIFSIQTEISRAIIEAISSQVIDEGGEMLKPATENFEAYNLYLLGRHHFHKRTESALSRAVDYFEQAIECDKKYALAYAGLADAYSLLTTGYYGNLSWRRAAANAQPAAERALALEPGLAEAHASIGLIQRNQKDLASAAASLQRAIELNPNYTMGHIWYGLVLNTQGHYQEAAAKNHEAFLLDPLSPIVNTNVGYDAVRFGDDEEAIARFRNAMELDPAFAVPYSGMARLCAMRGRLGEAMRWSSQAVERAPTRSFYLGRKGLLFLQFGEFDRAEEWICAALRQAPGNPFISDAVIAMRMARNDREVLESIVREQSTSYSVEQRAQISYFLGAVEDAVALYKETEFAFEDFVRSVINDDWVWRLPHAINVSCLKLRQGDTRAHEDLHRYLEHIDSVVGQGVINPDLHYWTASIHAVLNDDEQALSVLRDAIGIGWRHVWWAECDPNLEGLTGHDEFRSLMENAWSDIARDQQSVTDLHS